MTTRNLIFIVLAIVVATACHGIASKSRYASLFSEAVTIIDDRALQKVTEQQLFDSAMTGMLGSLDENSAYIWGDENRQLDEHLRQEFGGIGIFVAVHPKTKELTVTSPLPDSPAFNSGIRAGDVIEKINDESVLGIPVGEALRRMRGPVGESVRLTLRRSTSPSHVEVTLVREIIQTQTVLGDARKPDGTWEYFLPEDSRIGYINITEFAELTQRELSEALEKIKPRAEALILDLRSNGGGILDCAVAVSDMFLGRKVKIVELRGRQNRLIPPVFEADPDVNISESVPMVILVDRFTASASEIVAACLQDHQRAIIIGEQTYGKGTVQERFPLDVARASIKVTIATYWRPSGQNIDHTIKQDANVPYGVQPNSGFQIDLSEADLLKVLTLRNRRQYKMLDIFRDDETRGAERSSEIAESKISEDPVLKRAIEYLKQVLDGKNST